MSTDDSGDRLVPTARWREWVGEHPVLAPAVIGLMATQIATIIGYYLRGIGLPQVPWPLYNGVLFAPGEGGADFGRPASFFVGQSVHMVDGMIFAILYAVTFQGRLPLPNTSGGSIAKGMIYGTVLAIISMGFLVPYVYVPKSGFGFFSFGTDDGWKLPASILLFHFAYGFILGLLYQLKSDRSPQ